MFDKIPFGLALAAAGLLIGKADGGAQEEQNSQVIKIDELPGKLTDVFPIDGGNLYDRPDASITAPDGSEPVLQGD